MENLAILIVGIRLHIARWSAAKSRLKHWARENDPTLLHSSISSGSLISSRPIVYRVVVQESTQGSIHEAIVEIGHRPVGVRFSKKVSVRWVK